MHHCCGISWHGSSEGESQKQTQVAERIMQRRWVTTGEVNMMGAKLLAVVNCKRRGLMRRCHALRTGSEGPD